MRMSAGLLVLPLLALSGCGAASGAVPDTSSDLDCSVVSFYFSGLAEHERAPVNQRRAAAAIDAWYRAKVQQEVAEGRAPEALLVKAGPVLDAVKRDPRAAIADFQACSDRAVADPAFNGFARRLR